MEIPLDPNRQPNNPRAEEVERAFYEILEEGLMSGKLLFALHEEHPFTRPGLPVRRARAFEEAGAPRGSAVQAAGNMILTVAGLIDSAGRQEKPEHRTVATIATYIVAGVILEGELDKLEDEAWEMSAADMAQKLDDQYGDWVTLPPDHIVPITDEGETFDITARMAQAGLSLAQEKLAEAAAI